MEGGGKREKSEEDKGRKEEMGKWRGKKKNLNSSFHHPGYSIQNSLG